MATRDKHSVPLFNKIRRDLTRQQAITYRNELLHKMDNIADIAERVDDEAIFKAVKLRFMELKKLIFCLYLILVMMLLGSKMKGNSKIITSSRCKSSRGHLSEARVESMIGLRGRIELTFRLFRMNMKTRTFITQTKKSAEI